MTTPVTDLDGRAINTIRFLAVDAVEKAKSGHPGMPMGAAAMGYVLWDRFLKHNPADPGWPDRDRFVLSAGHGSMLLYSLLYLAGYHLSLADLQQFRQWDSLTPGHPEYYVTPGVEATTGPLGQGFGNAVGMALTEFALAGRFNRPGYEIVDHFTYVFASDGDMMEGVSGEAASLAGTLGLGKLVVLYDDNNISIEGSTFPAFQENVAGRFAAYGWQVIGPINGMDPIAVDGALRQAQKDVTRPTLIVCQTIIGYGSPEQSTGKVHGEPLGGESVKAAKEALGWPQQPTFLVPPEVLEHTRQALQRGAEAQADWERRMDEYTIKFPELAAEFKARMRNELPEGWDAGLDSLFPPDSKPIATRSASGKVINALAPRVPALMGGSADLAPSTKTLMDEEGDFGPADRCGRNLHFGVREHGMGAIANGMAMHGGVIPYTATFLIFSDYMRPPMRLAALTGLRVIHVFTHDSIGLGEDGPTHQPVEQYMNLRAVPNYSFIRPADATETAEAWKAALRNTGGPTGIALTRQNLPVIDRTKYAPAGGLQQGGYVLWQSGDGTPDVILIATGSEVSVALEAAERLAAEGVNVRVVSMPCWRFFDAQLPEYRDSVLPPQVRARVSVEAGVTLGWEHYLGTGGIAIGLDHFGASAPGKVLLEKFGFTPDRVVAAAKDVMGKK
ncbi:MAG: transketolase [Armatimonadota bacterium]